MCTAITGLEDEKRARDATLDELNATIAVCVEALPQVNIRQIQELVQGHSKTVHVADVVCTLLLENGAAARPAAAGPMKLQPRHRIRSPEYRNAVESLLFVDIFFLLGSRVLIISRNRLPEFASLSQSTIRGVLAENNHSFTDARATLLVLVRNSWRAAISSWWYSRPAPPPISSARGGTGCAELDDELFDIRAPEREVAVSGDQKLAEELNIAQYDLLIECGCCFGDVVWEQSAACAAGHLICRDCLIRGAQDSNNASVLCLSAATDERCVEIVPRSVLAAVLPPTVLQAFEDRAARVNVKQCGLAVVSCPFCPFAEFEETPHYRFNRGKLAILWVVICVALSRLLPLNFTVTTGYVVVTATLYAIGTSEGLQRFVALSLGADAAARSMAAKRRGTRFVCRNTACGLGSCTVCNKAWSSMTSHNCAEDGRKQLRLHIEQAMADAVKRVCPQCRCAFVKDGGCNKMTCSCGYIMWYVARF